MITPTENGISRGTPSQLEDDLRREAAMVPMSLEQRMLFLGAGLASLEARVAEIDYRTTRPHWFTEKACSAAEDTLAGKPIMLGTHREMELALRKDVIETDQQIRAGLRYDQGHLAAIAWHLEQLRAAK